MSIRCIFINQTRMGWFGMLARWFLGGTYLYMGLSKVLHPVEFLKLVRQYELVHSAPVLDSMAALLPWFEVACGLFLILGVAVRGTALVSLMMLIPFTMAVFHRALAIKTTLAIGLCAVKFDCGCGNGEELFCRKLAENIILMGLSAWFLNGGGCKGSLRYWLIKPATRLGNYQ